MTNIEQNQYYTAEKLAGVLNIKRKTIYTQINKGKFPLPYFKLGKSLLFLVSDVETYLNSCRKEANTLPEKNKEIQTKPIKNESDIKVTNQTKMINQRVRIR